MNVVKFLSLGLLVAVGVVHAKNQCFHPYNLNVVNKSGGVATLVHTKDVAGMTRGAKMANASSKRLQVNDLGARISFEVGPEKQKQKVGVALYDVTGANPHIVLEPKMIKAFDVNTMQGKTYEVMFKNESGGIATVNGCSAKELDIANGATARVHVHAGAMANVVSGPEHSKSKYMIMFFEQTSKPSSIVLLPGSVIRGVIEAKGVNVKVRNGLFGRMSRGLAPQKKMDRGARLAKVDPMAPAAAPTRNTAHKKCATAACHAKMNTKKTTPAQKAA